MTRRSRLVLVITCFGLTSAFLIGGPLPPPTYVPPTGGTGGGTGGPNCTACEDRCATAYHDKMASCELLTGQFKVTCQEDATNKYNQCITDCKATNQDCDD